MVYSRLWELTKECVLDVLNKVAMSTHFKWEMYCRVRCVVLFVCFLIC